MKTGRLQSCYLCYNLQWATTYTLGKGHTDVASLPLVIWCSWVRRDAGLTSNLAHHSPSGAQWGSRSTLILKRASILACIGKREASSPALDWFCALQTFNERERKIQVTKLSTLSPKSSPLSALDVGSIDWKNSWIILSRQLKYTHPTLLDRICEK